MDVRRFSVCILLLSLLLLTAPALQAGGGTSEVDPSLSLSSLDDPSRAQDGPVPAAVALEPQFALQVARLAASDAAPDSRFGGTVAIDGDTLVVGDPFDGQLGYRAGAAYVFQRTGTAWTQQAKLTASDGAAEDWFGVDVAIEGDTLVVGAFRDDQGAENAGAVYVFQGSGASWIQQAKLTASDAPASRQFGHAVSLNGDILVVGAWQDGQRGAYAGAAYIFERSGTAWTPQAKLTASDGAPSDFFGFDVAVSGDTAVVGAIYDDDGASGAGSAYVFQRSGSAWPQVQKLTASDVGDSFGCAVDIDGDTIVIGSYTKDLLGIDVAGAAYIYQRSGLAWTEQQKLVASDAAISDQFGWSVAIQGDILLVGAITFGKTGYAYAFLRTGTIWSEQQKLVPGAAAAGDAFGDAVAIDGEILAIGSSGADDGLQDSGSVYVYQVTAASATATPSQDATLVYTDAQGFPTTVQVPSEAVSEPTTLVYRPLPTVSAPAGLAFANHAFDLAAYQDDGEQIGLAFDVGVTVTVHYADADVATVMDEADLALMLWDGGTWLDAATTCAPPSAYDRDTAGNRLAVPICHLSTFGLFGPTQQTYLPLVVQASPD